jgi:hypothetical protein
VTKRIGGIANERTENEFMDLILRGGRVIDPAQALDGIRDVALRMAASRPSHRGSQSLQRRNATSPAPS